MLSADDAGLDAVGPTPFRTTASPLTSLAPGSYTAQLLYALWLGPCRVTVRPRHVRRDPAMLLTITSHLHTVGRRTLQIQGPRHLVMPLVVNAEHSREIAPRFAGGRKPFLAYNESPHGSGLPTHRPIVPKDLLDQVITVEAKPEGGPIFPPIMVLVGPRTFRVTSPPSDFVHPTDIPLYVVLAGAPS